MNRIISRVLVVAATSIALGTLGLGILGWQFDRPPFELTKLDGLVPGMSQDQVRDVLGPPSSVFHDSWAYSRMLSWPIVYVYFDESGRYASHRYDF